MNKEEIDEALKLIKEPITVNSIEYKYFDQENYEKLLRVYENCRWFIDNYDEINKYLHQELQRKDNNWNELKKYVEDHDDCWDLQAVLDKIKELENGQSND